MNNSPSISNLTFLKLNYFFLSLHSTRFCFYLSLQLPICFSLKLP